MQSLNVMADFCETNVDSGRMDGNLLLFFADSFRDGTWDIKMVEQLSMRLDLTKECIQELSSVGLTRKIKCVYRAFCWGGKIERIGLDLDIEVFGKPKIYDILDEIYRGMNDGSGQEFEWFKNDPSIPSMQIGDTITIGGFTYTCDSRGWRCPKMN